jgi:hypothetical protein
MLALHSLQRQSKTVCGDIAFYSRRHYAIDGRLAIDIHKPLEEEHLPFHGFSSFSPPAAGIRRVAAPLAFYGRKGRYAEYTLSPQSPYAFITLGDLP